jgi:hypothetical protein
MAKKLSKAAQACISREVPKHCKKKRRRCKISSERKQAVAISYAVCRRKGFRSIPAQP